jgi:AraC-like DNA-binding protein
MKLYIKNMVSIRCKILVRTELEKLGIVCDSVELGEVQIKGNLPDEARIQLDVMLKKSGLELMEDKKSMLIEKIKNVIVELIHYTEEPLTINFSDYLSAKLGLDYTYLSNLFSEVQGTTIEQYIIIHKIERVKELLVYNELTLTEIAHLLHYSSVSHLSSQFKNVTGLTPSHFKKIRHQRRSTLENL